MLFLDAHKRWLSHQPVVRGSLSQTRVHPREVAKDTLALGAHGMVLANNQAGGSVKNTQAVARLTRTLQEALTWVGVVTHEHIIFAQGQHPWVVQKDLL